MSVITSYTITCDKKLRDDGLTCARVIGPHLTLWAAQEEAEAAGWKLHYGHSPFRLDGDRCPDHIAPLDRVSWE